jgi:AcrR family transcriptional regulator
MAATIVATHERATAAERILRAAMILFRERGYHGSSMRTLARALRMEAASLYYHFRSKQEILFAILDRTLDDLLAGVGRAVASADGPEARLRAAVRFHVLFHTDSQHQAFLSHSELRSLTQANLRMVLTRRDEYERVFRGLLASGARAGGGTRATGMPLGSAWAPQAMLVDQDPALHAHGLDQRASV